MKNLNFTGVTLVFFSLIAGLLTSGMCAETLVKVQLLRRREYYGAFVFINLIPLFIFTSLKEERLSINKRVQHNKDI